MTIPTLPESETVLSWHGFIELRENRSALKAMQRFVSQFLTRDKIGKSSKANSPTQLLIHGVPGCGKSFLLQAATQHLTEQPGGYSLQTLSVGELPTTRSDENAADWQMWEHVDLLFLEDLQHLARKKSQVFCRLVDLREARHRPTVFTSSVGPAGLTKLPRRLTSRLAAGLVVQIQPIGRASRKQMIMHLLESNKLNLTEEAVQELLTRSAGGGLRAVHGLVHRVKILLQGKIAATSAESLVDLLEEQEKLSTISRLERILWQTSLRYGVKPAELLSGSRRKELVAARQAAMYLARELTEHSLPQLGKFFGGRDHTTVMHAHRKMTEQLSKDRSLASLLSDLKAELE